MTETPLATRDTTHPVMTPAPLWRVAITAAPRGEWRVRIAYRGVTGLTHAERVLPSWRAVLAWLAAHPEGAPARPLTWQVWSPDEAARRYGAPVSPDRTAATSRRSVEVTARNQRGRLLLAHAQYQRGLTDEEAAEVAGLPPHSEYASRCAELVRLGLLLTTEHSRPAHSGHQRVVRQITAAGIAKAVAMTAEGAACA